MDKLSEAALAALEEFKTILTERGIDHDGTTEGVLDAVFELLMEMEDGETDGADNGEPVAASKARRIARQFGQRVVASNAGNPDVHDAFFTLGYLAQYVRMGQLASGVVVASAGVPARVDVAKAMIRAANRMHATRSRVRKAAKAGRRAVMSTQVGPSRTTSRDSAIRSARREYESGIIKSHAAKHGGVFGRPTGEDQSFLAWKEKTFINAKLQERDMTPLNDAEISGHGIRNVTGREVVQGFGPLGQGD